MELIKDEAHALYGWAIVIALTLLGFRFSEGTLYHQLLIGVLISSVTLFVAMALLELVWRVIVSRQSKQNGFAHRSNIDNKV
ncbi:MAG TPA: hypothetical protein VMM15_24365 [Bradyrhizobium sp.]|nr:hypothetical protein [Bradyrhizobium sp.]